MVEQGHDSYLNSAGNEALRLRRGVFFVEGAKRGALYDTNTGNVYSLNQEAVTLVKTKSDLEFWKKLSSMGLSEYEQGRKNSLDNSELEKPRQNLEFVWLEITGRCNERCLHCYGNFSNKQENSTSHLLHDEWKKAIRSLKNIGCDKIQFIGGEPFLYHGEIKAETVLDLASFAREQGIDFIEIFTNATRVSEEDIRRMKSLGIQVATSIYSSEQAIHDDITRRTGSYDRSLTTVLKLKDAGIPVRAAVIIMKQNQDTIEQTLEMLQSLGITTRFPDIVRPNGRGQEKEIMPKDDIFTKYGLIKGPNFFVSFEKFQKTHFYHPCLAGKIAINSSGFVIPCIFSRNQLMGNIRQKDLQTIIDSPDLRRVWETTKDKILVCRDCEYRYGCSDCRPMAEGANDGKSCFNAPYPRCTYNPYEGEWGEGTWRLDGEEHVIYKNTKIN